MRSPLGETRRKRGRLSKDGNGDDIDYSEDSDHRTAFLAREDDMPRLLPWADVFEQVMMHAYHTNDDRREQYLRALNAKDFPNALIHDDITVDYENLLYTPSVEQFHKLTVAINVIHDQIDDVTRRMLRGKQDVKVLDVAMPSVWVQNLFDMYKPRPHTEVSQSVTPNIERPLPRVMEDIFYISKRIDIINADTHQNEGPTTIDNFALDITTHLTDYAGTITGRIKFHPTGTDRQMEYADFVENEAEYTRDTRRTEKLERALNNIVVLFKNTFPKNGFLYVNSRGDIELRVRLNKPPRPGSGVGTSSTASGEPEFADLKLEKIPVPPSIASLFTLLRVSNINRFRHALQTSIYQGWNDPKKAYTITTQSPLSHLINFDSEAIAETQKIYKDDDIFDMKMYRDTGNLRTIQHLYGRLLVAAFGIALSKDYSAIGQSNAGPFITHGMQVFGDSISYASVFDVVPGLFYYSIMRDNTVPLQTNKDCINSDTITTANAENGRNLHRK